MLAAIGGLIGLILRIFDMVLESNVEKKKLKQEALDGLKTGIKERDPSRITAAFAAFNRV